MSELSFSLQQSLYRAVVEFKKANPGVLETRTAKRKRREGVLLSFEAEPDRDEKK